MRILSMQYAVSPVKLIILTLMVVVLAGCAKRETLPADAKDKLVVVATILPLADWARQVGGDRVYVATLLPAGASPHTFDPGPAQMRLVSHSAVFIKAGLKMDDWGSRLAAANPAAHVLSIGDELLSAGKLPDVSHLGNTNIIGIDQSSHDLDHAGHSHGDINPHFWMDPQLAIESVALIQQALIAADPAGKSVYESNASRYSAQLKAMDAKITSDLAPYSGKGFVSFHNAWPYFAQRYRLKILGVIEEYAGKTPSEKYLRTITDMVKQQNVKTIFTEPQLNPHVAQMIATETGASVALLDPYGTENSEDRATYIQTMDYNSGELIRAFQKSQK